MKKVMVVTGTRADYGIYYPLLKAIQEASDLKLELLVTGMHLHPHYGNTIDFIKADGFQISAKVETDIEANHAGMAKSIGLGIVGMTEVFQSVKPDCVVVLGDRGEMLAATISSVYLNIPTLHLHGGEVSGSVDESVRHAISKLAHLHLTATKASRERLIKMGEDPWRVQVVGAPRLELIMKIELPKMNDVKVKYGLDFTEDYGLLIYHPVTTAKKSVEKELASIFQAIREEKMPFICVMPNSDAGSEDIENFYRQFNKDSGIYKIVSFEHYDYLSVLKNAFVMVGNSSSGIIEAASFKVPVINIGTRQFRREKSSNTIDINADYDELKAALFKVRSKEFQEQLEMVENVYYQEDTSGKILRVIRELVDYGEKLIQKTISY
ncbi:GDP/UDP-N,N'-diacetylbacillosamine 2-epimerase (hydrolysing) [Fontibacillus phaseoli]|uniref:GDP/UDP-N,N'-diacetylbacillosamine 2-epimerase (Hydrolysing) n=1 Tax=Fontibacillus phaseoli TaxID=1416533 RepID=A0A369BC18_9BACL|nr:UDP-N-acetylglucosamine 2-epimerase [Fontibacillus phaseoli]RCX19069.1 GDP/UDP-N,N'-diacetylbacillosamine 2-epimerase (hydrolysing) [Fontibacillus phaseoli]